MNPPLFDKNFLTALPVKILLRKTSLLDYPGRISSVFFFPACNLRCPWCHNGELLTGALVGLIGVEDALAHIRKRASVLGGVVLSGGEPCLYDELSGLIGEIKKRKLPVKLDTNGTFPAMLENLFSREETRPDFLSLDLKIAPARYGEPGDKLVQSAALIRESGIEHEYRSLALPGGFITEDDIEALAPLADTAPWYFRPFKAGNCLDPAWNSLEENAADAEARAKALTEKARELGKNALFVSN